MRPTIRMTFAITIAMTAPFSTQTSAATNSAGAPSVVLVHGTWADGSSWAKVIHLLQARGIHVVAVQNPCRSLKDDVATTKRVIDAQPGPVVLVGHSWGGMVITDAGSDRKVKALVYVNAFAPEKGQSVNDLGKGKPAPPWAALLKSDSAGYVYMPQSAVPKYFAQDLPLAQAKVIAATQVPAQRKSFDEKVTTAAWKHKPSWAIVSRQDRMIDPKAEAAMAKHIGAHTTTINSSHVAMLSKPKEVTAVILAAVASTQRHHYSR